jgi:hypothetical protein
LAGWSIKKKMTKKEWLDIIGREWHYTTDSEFGANLGRLYFFFTSSPTRWLKQFVWRRRSRPYAAEVEDALREVCQQDWFGQSAWEARLQRLDRAKRKQQPLESLLKNLRHSYWVKRFVARHLLLDRGGEAVAELVALAQDAKNKDHNTPGWLLESIAHETTARLSTVLEQRVCPVCWARCGVHKLDVPALTFYGCRFCRRSWGLLPVSGTIIAVLDANWSKTYTLEHDILRLNLLQIAGLVEFDQVELIQADDEMVERFAVNIGNDTDPIRKKRYATATCYLHPDCHLSENTRRILERTFSQVSSL